MRLVIVFFILIGGSSLAFAQVELLPKDERGKFIYYEEVKVVGSSKQLLQERMLSFFKKPYKDLRLKSTESDSVFTAAGKLVINKTVLVMSHPSGEILYQLHSEVKQGKFRFWLTDFSFIPYQRDRYGNFVATTNRGIPLENEPGKLNVAQWREYQLQTAQYTAQISRDIKEHMNGKTPVNEPVKEKTVIKKDW